MAPERSEGATKGLRVLNYVDPCVLMSNYYISLTVPLFLEHVHMKFTKLSVDIIW